MTAQRWDDLKPRIIWGGLLLVGGIFVLLTGGIVFRIAVAALTGAMIWELARMLKADDKARMLGAGAALAVFLASSLPFLLLLPVLGAAVIVMSGHIDKTGQGRFALYSAAVLLGCLAMILMRVTGGASLVLWLALVVIASDVAGYFAGRMIGGAKFWPAISPKKTWSGTIAGWVMAACVGLVFGGLGLALWSIPVALSGQMGDIAESALKRHVGVKDSSDLIPGHGGVLDRFDAMLGAALVAGVLWFTGILPEV